MQDQLLHLVRVALLGEFFIWVVVLFRLLRDACLEGEFHGVPGQVVSPGVLLCLQENRRLYEKLGGILARHAGSAP